MASFKGALQALLWDSLTLPKSAAANRKLTRPEALSFSNAHLVALKPLTLSLSHLPEIWVPALRLPTLSDLMRALSIAPWLFRNLCLKALLI